MKGSFLAIAVLSLFVAPTMARAQAGGFGIKGGLSYGNVSNNGALPGTISQRSGFAIGVGANTGGVVGFGIEGLYAQRGFTSSTANASRKLDYIDVPLYVRVSFSTPIISPFAYAGPQGSYELNCGTDSGNCTDSGRPKVTYAGIIGAGLRFAPLGGLSVEGRYVYGLTDLKWGTVSTTNSYQSRSFMLLLGIGF
jgi:opacity protein-like surface antigen